MPNHTSDRHPWFVAARSSQADPRRDFYIWGDPAPGGGPPNDWRSSFGGPAWRWEEATGQFALTSFYPQQVDLNWENPEVRTAVTDAMRWWVDRGVDGFRLDVVHRLSKAGPKMQNGPRAHDYVRQIRDAVGPGTLLLGEVWMFDLEEVVRYLEPGELDLSFIFPFAFSAWDARAIAELIELVERLWTAADAWPCWHIGNHDMSRPASRWGQDAVRTAAVVYLTLRGTAVIYQGDELGMVDGDVPPERRRDGVGRDPCRTPMQWDASPNAGFCPESVEPYLPRGPDPTNPWPGVFPTYSVAASRSRSADDSGGHPPCWAPTFRGRRLRPGMRTGSQGPSSRSSLPSNISCTFATSATVSTPASIAPASSSAKPAAAINRLWSLALQPHFLIVFFRGSA